MHSQQCAQLEKLTEAQKSEILLLMKIFPILKLLKLSVNYYVNVFPQNLIHVCVCVCSEHFQVFMEQAENKAT